MKDSIPVRLPALHLLILFASLSILSGSPVVAAPATNIQKKQLGKAGICVRISTQTTGRLIIMEVLPGGPAEQADLKPSDEIVQIDEEWIAGMDLTAAVEILRGKPGTEVEIFVKRNGRPTRKYLLMRESLNLPKELE